MTKVVMAVVCENCGVWQDCCYEIADPDNDMMWCCDICCGYPAGDADCRAFAIPDAIDAKFYDMWLAGFDMAYSTDRESDPYPYPVADVRPVLEPML